MRLLVDNGSANAHDLPFLTALAARLAAMEPPGRSVFEQSLPSIHSLVAPRLEEAKRWRSDKPETLKTPELPAYKGSTTTGTLGSRRLKRHDFPQVPQLPQVLDRCRIEAR